MVDSQGDRASASAVVQVLDQAAIDALLQAKWAALRNALLGRDVDAATSIFALTSREAYRAQFLALDAASALPQVGIDLGSIALLQVVDGGVEYDLRAVRDGVEYSFSVLFVIDVDGVWRLWAF